MEYRNSRVDASRPRRHVRAGQPRVFLLAGLLGAVLLMVPLGWILFKRSADHSDYHSPDAAPSKSPARAAVVEAVNQAVAQAGKNVPAPDVVVNTATLHNRAGQIYLVGTVENRSSRAYSGAHVVFDALDQRRNPAGIAQGDVGPLGPGKQAPFDFGPLNPETRLCVVRSIEPVQ